MKIMKRFFIVQMLLLVGNLCFSQNYTPFYLDNAKWTMERITPVIGPKDVHSYWEIYTLNDTLINEIEYKILATRNICQLRPVGYGENQTLKLNETINTGEYIFGGIREENKRIYFRKFNKEPQWQLLQSRIKNFTVGKDHLLYDYNFIPGDTIQYSDNYFSIIRGISGSIEGHNTYDVANSSAFSFPNESEPLYEGIGSYYGLFGSYDSYLTYLKCFSIDDEILIFDYECEPCSEFLSNTVIDELGTINIYPNPFINELNITNTTKLKIKEIRVFNTRGELIITKEQLSNNNTQINFESIQRRIIFLYISFENGSTLIKKVVSI